jgi:F0F1-type ATP synthase delta subunit
MLKGQDVNNYHVFLDRVVDIKNALENSMDEFENVISSFAEREDINVYMEDPLTKEEVDLLKVIFKKHIKTADIKRIK